MTIHPIHTRKDYSRALKRLDRLFDARKGSSESDELEVLGILIEDYERRNDEIEAPDPVEAIKFRLEQLGMSQSDFAKVIGHKSHASEILSRKRKLSLAAIRRIQDVLLIPAEVLVKAY